MKILFIGGNGNISWNCMKEALWLEHDVTILHRGVTEKTRRKIPNEVKVLHADYRDKVETWKALRGTHWDAVIDFITYNRKQAQFAAATFLERTNRYYFISTTSVYQRGSKNIPYNEDSPLDPNPIREYTKGKIEAEEVLLCAFRDFGLPAICIRPGYTYDTIVPVSCGMNDWTVPQRMLEGKPVIILGDGSNLATFTHSFDFATGLMGLVTQYNDYSSLLGHVFNITGDVVLNWKEATDILAKVLGVKNYNVLYIPTATVVKRLKKLFPPLPSFGIPFNPSVTHSLSHMAEDFQSQKMWCELFDNSKLKRWLPKWKPTITLEQGLKKTVRWLEANPARKRFDYALHNVLDLLVQSERSRI